MLCKQLISEPENMNEILVVVLFRTFSHQFASLQVFPEPSLAMQVQFGRYQAGEHNIS